MPIHSAPTPAELPLHAADLTCFPFGIGEPHPVHRHPTGRRPSPWSTGHFGGCGMADGIRRLGVDDVVAWRALRLEALERHPDAFGASHDEEAALPLSVLVERLEQGCVVGAESRGVLVGSAGLLVERTFKKRHKAVLWGVYVRHEARGAGIGRRLVGAVVDAAAALADQLHTAVVVHNQTARDLYLRLGFVPYGVEPRALEVNGRFLDEELLVLDLASRRAEAASARGETSG